MRDAYNLGWKLAHVLRGGPESPLDTYEGERLPVRLPVAAAVLGLSKQIYRTRSLKRGDATNQLRLHYRTSALSSGKPLGGLHPGDRMPDVRLADGSRLFERMRGTHATEFVMRNGTRILIRPDGYRRALNLYAKEVPKELACRVCLRLVYKSQYWKSKIRTFYWLMDDYFKGTLHRRYDWRLIDAMAWYNQKCAESNRRSRSSASSAIS